jgi:O-methyltransferase
VAEIDFRSRYIDLLKSSLCASLYDESAWRRVTGPMKQEAGGNPLKQLKRAVLRGIVNSAAKRGLILIRPFKYNPELRQKGIDWPLFGFTMTGRNRLDTLQQCLETVLAEDVPGDIVETGVWRGGSMILAAALLSGSTRNIWCCDSFEGMPEPTVEGESFSGTEDFSDLDYLSVSLEQVKENFRRYGLLTDQVRFLKGWFSETLPTAPIERVALLRLDGDLYESTRDALVPLYPKVGKGGFVIVDDYNSWPGCKQAVTEYRDQHGISSPIVPIDNHAVYWRVE